MLLSTTKEAPLALMLRSRLPACLQEGDLPVI
jgi:hypothetical protein